MYHYFSAYFKQQSKLNLKIKNLALKAWISPFILHYHLWSKLTGCIFVWLSQKRKWEAQGSDSALPWGNRHQCPVVSSVPAEFVYLINLHAPESPSSVQKQSWALPSPSLSFLPRCWHNCIHTCSKAIAQVLSSAGGAWEGIAVGVSIPSAAASLGDDSLNQLLIPPC